MITVTTILNKVIKVSKLLKVDHKSAASLWMWFALSAWSVCLWSAF